MEPEPCCTRCNSSLGDDVPNWVEPDSENDLFVVCRLCQQCVTMEEIPGTPGRYRVAGQQKYPC